MKKIVFLGLVLLLVVPTTGFSQDIPLPKDIVIKAPSSELAKEIAAFSGKWKGKWNDGVDFILVITEIDLEKAEIIYASPDYPGLKIVAVCTYETAKVVSGKNIKIQFSRAPLIMERQVQFGGRMVGVNIVWYAFEMQGDLKTLKGICEYSTTLLKATLNKIE